MRRAHPVSEDRHSLTVPCRGELRRAKANLLLSRVERGGSRRNGGAVLLLADHEEQAEVADAVFEQRRGGVNHGGDDALGARPQMRSSSSREGMWGGTVSMCVESWRRKDPLKKNRRIFTSR